MSGAHFLLERIDIKALRFAAGLALNQRRTDGFYLQTAFLFTPDQIAYVFAVVGVMSGMNLRLDPAVLLVSQGIGFSQGSHGAAFQVGVKRCLAAAHVPFEVPGLAERKPRLASVLEVIYLIFNEGYAATGGDDWMRPALCQDALRLGRVLAGPMPEKSQVHGLVALTEFKASRTAARLEIVERLERELLLQRARR